MRIILTILLFLSLTTHAQTGKGVHIDSATGKWWTVVKPDTGENPIKYKHKEDSIPMQGRGLRAITSDTARSNFRKRLMKK